MNDLRLKMGIVALGCGVVALLIAITASSGGFTYEKEELDTIEKGVSILREKIMGDSASVEPARKFVIEHLGVLIFGIVAIVIGVCAQFIQRGKKSSGFMDLFINFNAAAAGATLGIMAVAWSYILFAVIVAVIVYVLSALFSGGIDF